MSIAKRKPTSLILGPLVYLCFLILASVAVVGFSVVNDTHANYAYADEVADAIPAGVSDGNKGGEHTIIKIKPTKPKQPKKYEKPKSGGKTSSKPPLWNCSSFKPRPGVPNEEEQTCYVDTYASVFEGSSTQILGYNYSYQAGPLLQQCLAQDGPGKEVIGVNVRLRETVNRRKNTDTEAIILSYTSNVEGHVNNCIIRAYKDTVKSSLCYASAIADYNMVVPSSQHLGGSRVLTTWGKASNPTIEDCLSSRNVQVSFNTMIKKMGRYEINTRFVADRITVRTYAAVEGAKTPEDKIVKIERVGEIPGKKVYAQVVCDPAYSAAGNNKSQIYRGSWSYTWSDCLDPSSSSINKPNTYKCVGDGAPYLNDGAKRSNASIFRDGEDNRIHWNNPTITSSNLKTIHGVQTRVGHGGTPWDSPKKLSVGKNNVTLKTSGGTNVFSKLKNVSGSSKLQHRTPWMDGKLSDFTLTANWASNEGAPTRVQTDWKFDATWRTPSIRIDSVSVPSGAVTTTKTFTDIRATANCSGAINLDVVRAVNDVR